jgi:hypothetical protein
VPTRTRLSAVVVLLAVSLIGAACGGGGDSKPKEGTPAATGITPDCASVAPLALVKKTLDFDLTGPTSQKSPGGTTCVYGSTGGNSATQTVQLNGNVDKDSFAIVRNGYKSAHNPVSTIKGWGDEAYAAKVVFTVNINTFAVRKGRVSAVITSTAEFDHIKKLMKEVLKKL